MAKKKARKKSSVVIEDDKVVEIHLPDPLYTRLRTLQLGDIDSFDQFIVQSIFPESERFGMEHVRLVKKAAGADRTVNEAMYRKTCSSG